MTDQQKYTNKLQNTRALVIGGSSGLGFSTAEALLEHGAASVTISSSRPQKVSGAVERLEAAYPSKKGSVRGYACDLGDEEKLEENLEKLFKDTTAGGAEKLDHVIFLLKNLQRRDEQRTLASQKTPFTNQNPTRSLLKQFTAGDPVLRQPISSFTLATIKSAGTVRFFAPLILGKIAPPYMNPGPKSSITLTTGAISQRPRPDWTVIGAYATGLQGVTRGLALELKPLRVNLVSPGFVNTEMWGDAGDEGTAKQKEQLIKTMATNAPTGVAAGPEQLAESDFVAVYLPDEGHKYYWRDSIVDERSHVSLKLVGPAFL
ncbi:MAG: hypothetical protein M1831_007032 [Alyxoria varia]|nr:MAG: hypothetical protein M1831_007032 [Alyxoria varia]